MKNSVLYLSYTGLLQPLGRSQVLSYLKGLSDEYSIKLLSFEKDISDTESIRDLDDECKAHNISWSFSLYHKKPRMLATLLDMLYMARFIRNGVENGNTIVHCRSYVTCIVAFVLSYFLNFKFIFDMRAMWVDELVSSGRLKRKSITYIILKMLEKKMLRRADHVVSLTDAAVEHLLAKDIKLNRDKFSVITTCVDLSRFKPHQVKASFKEDSRKTVGVMGSITSGWFRQDILFQFLATVKHLDPSIEIQIITRDCAKKVSSFAKKFGLNDYKIRAVSPNEVPIAVSHFDFAAMFFKPDLGKLGSAPTRLGELLACGIPVVCNDGVGDMGKLVSQYNVGLILDNEKTIREIAEETVRHLYSSQKLSDRCIYAAKDYFSLAQGVSSYKRIYKSLI